MRLRANSIDEDLRRLERAAMQSWTVEAWITLIHQMAMARGLEETHRWFLGIALQTPAAPREIVLDAWGHVFGRTERAGIVLELNREEIRRERRLRGDVARARLVEIIMARGGIPVFRVSIAKARGRAGKYPYWGVAEYVLTLSRNGEPMTRVVMGASSDRRSLRLAEQDAEEVADRHGGILLQGIGRLNDDDAIEALLQIEGGSSEQFRLRELPP